MLRVIKEEPVAGVTVLRVEGKAVNRWLGVLRRAAEAALRDSVPPVRMDVADLTYVDADGLALCRDLARRGVAFVNCSGFIAAQLASESVDCRG